MDHIPVIDFAKIAQGTGNEQNWETISEEVRKACHGIGFMYILNHGIRKETIESAFEESKKFFQLPQSRKNDFPLDAANKYRGYTRSGQELLSPNSAFEFREGFAVVGINSPQKFPEELLTFKKALFDLEKECNVLTRTLLSLFGKALGLPDENHFLNANLGLTDASIANRVTLRTHWYPSINKDITIPSNSVRCGEHTDYGVCTLLFQDSMGGLEVRNSAGQWTPATPIADTVLVNLGDIMEIWTGGLFKATGHRVLIPEEEIRRRTPRQSIAYFVLLDDDCMITPLKSTKNYTFKENFESMSFAEFLDKRLGDTYQY
ncbi:unnamed protein product [Allacma fusca]|uniref:Fe2OG dioxygenase domain-containing protein n=1 Tax=Allacma fusca TaxID=39272 RepID=A0A8J2JB38_9HEXA|nr:unnamed protein product [Allacma fusca]